jgi:hypothetical protein
MALVIFIHLRKPVALKLSVQGRQKTRGNKHHP